MNDERPRDARIVCGANCTWWGIIYDIAKRGGLPCCPHCGSMLYEYPSMTEWWASVDRFEAAGHAGYHKLIEWTRDKHFKTSKDAVAAYKVETGIEVRLG